MIILSTLFFENGCWKMTAEILEREIKIFYIFFLSYLRDLTKRFQKKNFHAHVLLF